LDLSFYPLFFSGKWFLKPKEKPLRRWKNSGRNKTNPNIIQKPLLRKKSGFFDFRLK